MRRSEIFESFAKIAEEKGLISKGTDESVSKEVQKTRRHDSLSIDDIAKLYNLKPEAPKDAQYDRNIIERAHPDPVVIAPSYDKLNGLVENNNERQDILLHIVNKQSPDGQLTQRKYAERELTLALVRIGNDMDNRSQDDLRVLADTCLEQATTKSLKKEAFWPVVALVASLAGAFYAKQHLRFHSDGWARDYQKAIAELNDLLNANSNFGVGYDYKPEFLQQVNDIKLKLDEMNSAVEVVLAELDKIQTPRTRDELMRMAQDPNSQQAVRSVANFRAVLNQIKPYLQKVVTNFTSTMFKQRETADTGFFSNLVDNTEVLHGGKGLVADDFDDAAHALETVLYDLDNIDKTLVGADNKAAATRAELQAAQANAPVAQPSVEAPNAPVPSAQPAAQQQVATNPVQQVQNNQIENESEKLNKMLDQFPDLQ